MLGMNIFISSIQVICCIRSARLAIMPLNFNPPLLNSANPWATTREDLEKLYDCPYTGAITTRTSMWMRAFQHDPSHHQYCFFDDEDHHITHHSNGAEVATQPSKGAGPTSSLNTFGYSPFSSSDYVSIIDSIVTAYRDIHPGATPKPIIFSVAGTPSDIMKHYGGICTLLDSFNSRCFKPLPQLSMEINLSCPNIAGKPPPAYSRAQLSQYFDQFSQCNPDLLNLIQVGIKTPPYTYQTQFEELISALLDSVKPPSPCPISFLTATNTLGNCLVLDETLTAALASTSGSGIGGLAGSSLHPLALGNVATLRRMLDTHEELKRIEIIGVGGVSDAAGYKRMRAVGAAAVGVGTALGIEGVGVFEKIWGEAQENRL